MLRHSDKYLARQSLHHVLVLRIVAEVVYVFFLDGRREVTADALVLS